MRLEKRESNVTILVHEEDDAPYRECYMYMEHLPRIGDKLSIVPFAEPIEDYEVIDVTHAIHRKFIEGWMHYQSMPTIHIKTVKEGHKWRQPY